LNIEVVKRAARQFSNVEGNVVIEHLGNGLINQTYKVTADKKENSFVLQAINAKVFLKPEDILFNYKQVYDCLKKQKDAVHIPAPIAATTGDLCWVDDHKNYWRATAFVPDSYSPTIASDEKSAFTVGNSFAKFTSSLSSLDINGLKEIIPGFHNLTFRYEQFEWAVKHASINLLLKATHVIAELRQRKKLVDFFQSIQDSPHHPSRVMHHDCKISNILFDRNTERVICPVDLDTVMPGKFFSDLGDMIRSMTCTVDENSVAWEEIDVRPAFYKAVLDGYLQGVENIFSTEEINNIHYSGLLLIYMQALRFLTDFLQNDIYYKIDYPEQNLNRTLNQLILLEKLEEFLVKEYGFNPY
jgi:aminoglycoside phosphotransferase (APT) family kinase protein